MRTVRVLGIGGTSHVGKSTLATAVGARLGWRVVSTDTLGRHPGRPWRADVVGVPPHLVQHYTDLSVAELTAGQLAHYARLWPHVAELITTHAADPHTDCLVLEGSGLWPDDVVALDQPRLWTVWLTARPQVIAERIRRASEFEDESEAAAIVEKFLGRSVAYDDELRRRLTALGLEPIDVSAAPPVDELVDRCLASARISD